MTGLIRLILARLRHRRRDIQFGNDTTCAACSCGWEALYEHVDGSLSIEDDWLEHLNAVRGTHQWWPNPPTRRRDAS